MTGDQTCALPICESQFGVHTTILAMTAHALKGDRERCLAAGMDGYISKPIRAETLLMELERCIPATGLPPDSSPVQARPSISADLPQSNLQEVLHRQALLDRVEGDRALLAEMVELFFEEVPRQLSELHESIVRGDAPAAEGMAHKIKGAVGNFAAPAAAAAAEQAEKLARTGDLEGARAASESLKVEIERLQPVLTAFCTEVSQ